MDKSQSRYPNLWHIIMCYFHEDFDIFGENIKDIIKYHKNSFDKKDLEKDIKDIERFEIDNSDDLDSALEKDFGEQFDPKLWGHTTTSFLAELKRLLKE